MDLTSGEGGATSGNVTVASADGKSTGQVSLETGAASGAERKTAEAAAGYLAISCFDYPQAAGVISFRNEGVSLVVDSVAQTHHFLSTLVHPGPVRPLREPDPRGQNKAFFPLLTGSRPDVWSWTPEMSGSVDLSRQINLCEYLVCLLTQNIHEVTMVQIRFLQLRILDPLARHRADSTGRWKATSTRMRP